MPLTALQVLLAPQKQFVPFDPPFPDCSTIGGIVAASLNGPRRGFYGGVRDLVIGMKVVLASGEQIKAGGKVVKNVAGYDLCKLFVGSLGTLGIITEVTLRMAPIPETCAAVVASGELSQALQLAGDLSRSKLLPVAVLLSTGMANNWQLAVWFEGFEDTVARQVREVEAMARRISMSAATPDHQNIQHAWNDVRDFPLQRNRLTYRVTVPRASVAEVIQLVQSWRADAADPAIIADIPIGTVWIALDTSQKSAGRFSDLTSLAQRHHGHAVMFAAPPQLKQGIEVWGPSPPTLSLMREIKQRFDPQRLLNPGRLAGNL
jgi:glycolate oxidase FAD binding subunit